MANVNVKHVIETIVRPTLDKKGEENLRRELNDIFSDNTIDFNGKEFKADLQSLVEAFNKVFAQVGSQTIDLEKMIQMPGKEAFSELGRIAATSFMESWQSVVTGMQSSAATGNVADIEKQIKELNNQKVKLFNEQQKLESKLKTRMSKAEMYDIDYESLEPLKIDGDVEKAAIELYDKYTAINGKFIEMDASAEDYEATLTSLLGVVEKMFRMSQNIANIKNFGNKDLKNKFKFDTISDTTYHIFDAADEFYDSDALEKFELDTNARLGSISTELNSITTQIDKLRNQKELISKSATGSTLDDLNKIEESYKRILKLTPKKKEKTINAITNAIGDQAPDESLAKLFNEYNKSINPELGQSMEEQYIWLVKFVKKYEEYAKVLNDTNATSEEKSRIKEKIKPYTDRYNAFKPFAVEAENILSNVINKIKGELPSSVKSEAPKPDKTEQKTSELTKQDKLVQEYNANKQKTLDLLAKEKLSYEDILYLLKENQKEYAKSFYNNKNYDLGDEASSMSIDAYAKLVPPDASSGMPYDKAFNAVGMSVEDGAKQLFDYQERQKALSVSTGKLVDESKIEIQANYEKIKSYEELETVVKRYNELRTKQATQGELSPADIDELSSLVARIEATKDVSDDVNKYLEAALQFERMQDRILGTVKLNDMSQYLGISNPNAAEEARIAAEKAESERLAREEAAQARIKSGLPYPDSFEETTKPNDNQKAEILKLAEEYRAIMSILEKGNVTDDKIVAALYERARAIRGVVSKIQTNDSTPEETLLHYYDVPKETAASFVNWKQQDKLNLSNAYQGADIENTERAHAVKLIYQEIEAEKELAAVKQAQKEASAERARAKLIEGYKNATSEERALIKEYYALRMQAEAAKNSGTTNETQQLRKLRNSKEEELSKINEDLSDAAFYAPLNKSVYDELNVIDQEKEAAAAAERAESERLVREKAAEANRKAREEAEASARAAEAEAEARRKALLTQQSDGTATPEVADMQALEAATVKVTKAVNDKTDAFRTEKTEVDTIVEAEKAKLGELQTTLETIQGLFTNISQGKENLAEGLSNVNVTVTRGADDGVVGKILEACESVSQTCNVITSGGTINTDNRSSESPTVAVSIDESSLRSILETVTYTCIFDNDANQKRIDELRASLNNGQVESFRNVDDESQNIYNRMTSTVSQSEEDLWKAVIQNRQDLINGLSVFREHSFAVDKGIVKDVTQGTMYATNSQMTGFKGDTFGHLHPSNAAYSSTDIDSMIKRKQANKSYDIDKLITPDFIYEISGISKIEPAILEAFKNNLTNIERRRGSGSISDINYRKLVEDELFNIAGNGVNVTKKLINDNGKSELIKSSGDIQFDATTQIEEKIRAINNKLDALYSSIPEDDWDLNQEIGQLETEVNNLHSKIIQFTKGSNNFDFSKSSLLQAASDHNLPLHTLESELYKFADSFSASGQSVVEGSDLERLLSEVNKIRNSELSEDDKVIRIDDLMPLLRNVFGYNPNANIDSRDRNALQLIGSKYPELKQALIQKDDNISPLWSDDKDYYGRTHSIWRSSNESFRPISDMSEDERRQELAWRESLQTKNGEVKATIDDSAISRLADAMSKATLSGDVKLDTSGLATESTLAEIKNALNTISQKAPSTGGKSAKVDTTDSNTEKQSTKGEKSSKATVSGTTIRDEIISNSLKDPTKLATQSAKNEAAAIKEIESIYEKIGKLDAKIINANSEAEKAPYQREIASLENKIELKKKEYNLDVDQVALDKKRKDSKNTTLNMIEGSQAKRDTKTELKNQIKASQEAARMNKAKNAIGTADDLSFRVMSSDNISPEVQNALEQYRQQVQEVKILYDAIKNSDGAVPEGQQQELISQTQALVAMTDKLRQYEKLSGDNVSVIGKDALGNPSSFNSNDTYLGKYKIQLENAIRVATKGKASIKEFDATTKSLNYTIKTGKNEFTSYSATLRETDRALVSVQGSTKRTEGFFEAIKRKTREIATYFTGSSLIFKVVNELRQGITYVKEIDSALTELKKVTNETEETYDKFLDTASKTAAKVGSTIKDVVSSTADFARLNI